MCACVLRELWWRTVGLNNLWRRPLEYVALTSNGRKKWGRRTLWSENSEAPESNRGVFPSCREARNKHIFSLGFKIIIALPVRHMNMALCVTSLPWVTLSNYILQCSATLVVELVRGIYWSLMQQRWKLLYSSCTTCAFCRERTLMCDSGNCTIALLCITAFTLITRSLLLWFSRSLLTCKPTLPFDL